MPSTTPSPSASAAPAWVRHAGLAGWLVALTAMILPLWVVRALPFVDLPQHLYVLDVMRRLHDPATLYPGTFEFHFRFTPYLGYYGVMSLLGGLMPLEPANRVFLSLTVAALPLSTAFLLRALGRQAWPALLVAPIAYGDCMGWGFVNTCAAIPIALFTLAAFLRGLASRTRRRGWCVLFGIGLLTGFFMHPVPSGFLAFALPASLWMTRTPEERSSTTPRAGAWLRNRLPLLLAALPALTLAMLWLVFELRDPAPIRPGIPGFAWGPMFSAQNLQWESPLSDLQNFPWLLANLFRNDADLLGLIAVGIVAVLALPTRLFESPPETTLTGAERARPWVLVGIAFGLYLFLPLDIQGSIQYLSPRFAPMAGVLLSTLVPRGGKYSSRVLSFAAVVAVVVAMAFLATGLQLFDREADATRRLLPAVGDRPRIMALIHDPYSGLVTHPAYLHVGATLARMKGGITSYSLSGGRQIPLRYRGTPPAAPVSEWRSDLFDYSTMAPDYDHFLVRGAPADSLFHRQLGHELRVAAHEDNWWLLRRVAPAGPRP